MDHNFYLYWYNEYNLEIGAETAETIEEARTIISHWVPNMDAGDSFKIVRAEDM